MSRKVIYSLIVFCLLSLLMSAQQGSGWSNNIDQDYERYKSTFDENISAVHSSIHNETINFAPSPLPDWLCLPLPYEPNLQYVVGISDPNRADETGLQQAILRAESLHALMQKSRIQNVTDFYNVETGQFDKAEFGSRFSEYHKLSADDESVLYKGMLIDSCRTSFGEYIVLMAFTKSAKAHSSNQLLNCTFESMVTEMTEDGVTEFNSRFDWSCSNETSKDQFTIRSVNQLYDVDAQFNGYTADIPQGFLKYHADYKADKKSREKESERLVYGLWNGFISSLTDQLLAEYESSKSVITNAGDYHTSKTQHLNREISTALMSFGIDHIEIFDNSIRVHPTQITIFQP